MTEQHGAVESVEDVARQVRVALESADLSAFSELLDPDVRWGAPGAGTPACRNRSQVLAWYQRGRDAGTRADVTDVEVHGERILVSLTVRGTSEASARGGAALRWQVLTVSGGRIVDIVGFDDRSEASTAAGVTTT